MTNEQRTYTEEEFNHWLEVHTRDLRQENEKLRADLTQAKFHAAVAEWAVAGVLTRNVSLNLAVNGTTLDQQRQDAVTLAKALGMKAGAEFLHRAELAFLKHAEYSSLMMQCPPHVRFSHNSGGPEVTPFYSWPRPFA
jgi:hypothetical protein